MAKSQHVIELNGRNYDALTGKALNSSASLAQQTAAQKAKVTKASPSSQLVDGIRAPKRPMPSLKVGHSPEHAKTLMRHSVKKPTVIIKEKRQTPVLKPTTNVNHQALGADVSISTKPERILHAATVHKSALISKFGRVRNQLKTDIIPVKTPPITSIVAPKPGPILTSEPQSQLDIALEKADSHTQTRLKKTPKYVRVAHKLHLSPVVMVTSVFAFIALVAGGWLAYNNIPNIAMKVASTRAGVNATLPTYHPAGFSLKDPISYDHGQVSVKFTSNSDDRAFTVVQKTSSWNSQTLLDNVVAQHQYQTVQSNGRTIYIYGNNDATWVDGGTWYQIKGNSTLNSDQILKIADSL